MEDLLARHRKEQRDLTSKINQKKKSASKKTRKGVNEECTKLEADLKVKQQKEVESFHGTATDASPIPDAVSEHPSSQDDDLLTVLAAPPTETVKLSHKTEDLHLSAASLDHETDEISPQTRKPNRQKARLARRAAEQEAAAQQAAEEASNLPDLKERERTRMLEEFEKRGLQEQEVAANGHCLYSAVADQMRLLGFGLDGEEEGEVGGVVKREDYKIVRKAAAAYIKENEDEFVPFLEEPLEEYTSKIRDTGEWGGQLELMALAKSYGITINVLQGDGRVEKIEGGDGERKPETWLAYYRHGFGLGEHYNSLRATTKG